MVYVCIVGGSHVLGCYAHCSFDATEDGTSTGVKGPVEFRGGFGSVVGGGEGREGGY